MTQPAQPRRVGLPATNRKDERILTRRLGDECASRPPFRCAITTLVTQGHVTNKTLEEKSKTRSPKKTLSQIVGNVSKVRISDVEKFSQNMPTSPSFLWRAAARSVGVRMLRPREDTAKPNLVVPAKPDLAATRAPPAPPKLTPGSALNGIKLHCRKFQRGTTCYR